MATEQELNAEIERLLKEVQALTKQLDEKSPEAIYSITIDRNGGANITVRSRPGEPGQTFLDRLMRMKEEVEKRGFNAKTPLPEPTKSEQPPKSATPMPTKAEPTAEKQGEEKQVTFKAETMSATTSKGKVYWKVAGGMYKKFGVTIWGEVLAESGFDPDKLDPTRTYDLTGYTAYVYMNEDGKPSKVWKLAKV